MSSTYPLSLTAAGAYRQETVELARAFLEAGSWDEVRRQVRDENLLCLNGTSTRVRVGSELVKRLRTLEPAELAHLAGSHGDDQGTLVWLACCRTYPLVRDFSGELLAGRYARMVPDVPRTAYRAFADEQAALHPELAAATPTTRHRVEGRVYEIARACGLLDAQDRIVPLHPSPELVALVREAHPADLALLPGQGGDAAWA